MANTRRSSLLDVPASVLQLVDYDRLIPTISGDEDNRAQPTITAEVRMEYISSGYILSVTSKNPTGYSGYYEGMYPEYCFIYEVQAGEDADKFIKVMVLGDMEVLPAESNGEAGTRYRSNNYTKVFDDIQELQVARDTIIRSLYALYTNVATINRATEAMVDESVVIPTDINSSLDEVVKKLLESKAAYLQTKAMILAYEAEIAVLGKVYTRVKTAEDNLKLVNVALNEIGTPDQLAQSQAFFKTFGETLDRLDASYKATHEINPSIESAVTATDSALETATTTTSTVRSTLAASGKEMIDLTSGAPKSRMQAYVASVDTALESIEFALGASNHEIVTLKTVDIPQINFSLGTPAHLTMRGNYEADKDKAATGILGVQSMLAQIVPMIKVLAGVIQTTSASSRRIQAAMDAAQTKRDQLIVDADGTGGYAEHISNYIIQIQQYAPNFNPEQPFYRWVVNIEVSGSCPQETGV